MAQPDHFVVVLSVDNERVHLYDGAGQRTTRTFSEFKRRWTGHDLHVRRSSIQRPDQDAIADRGSSRIQFETLLLDKGLVPARGEPARFEFPFRNHGQSDLRSLTAPARSIA